METLKGDFRKLSSKTSDPASKATLAKMQTNFTNMQTILRLKLRKATQTSVEFERTVKNFSTEITSAKASQLIKQL